MLNNVKIEEFLNKNSSLNEFDFFVFEKTKKIKSQKDVFSFLINKDFQKSMIKIYKLNLYNKNINKAFEKIEKKEVSLPKTLKKTKYLTIEEFKEKSEDDKEAIIKNMITCLKNKNRTTRLKNEVIKYIFENEAIKIKLSDLISLKIDNEWYSKYIKIEHISFEDIKNILLKELEESFMLFSSLDKMINFFIKEKKELLTSVISSIIKENKEIIHKKTTKGKNAYKLSFLDIILNYDDGILYNEFSEEDKEILFNECFVSASTIILMEKQTEIILKDLLIYKKNNLKLNIINEYSGNIDVELLSKKNIFIYPLSKEEIIKFYDEMEYKIELLKFINIIRNKHSVYSQEYYNYFFNLISKEEFVDIMEKYSNPVSFFYDILGYEKLIFEKNKINIEVFSKIKKINENI